MAGLRSIGAVLLTALALVWPASPQAQDSAGEGVQWVEKPSTADMERLGPPEAMRDRVDGRAILDCSVTRTGRLQGCTVKSETPPGMGFGAAALRVAPLYRMTARAGEVDLEGSRISFAIRFRYAAATPPATTPTPTAAPQTPQAAGQMPVDIARLTPPTGGLMQLGLIPGWQISYLDLDRVAVRETIVDVVRLTVFSESEATGERRGTFEVSGLSIDCAGGVFALRGTRTFDRTGQAINWVPADPAPRAVEAGSVYGVLSELVCSQGVPARRDAEGINGALDAARRLLGQ